MTQTVRLPVNLRSKGIHLAIQPLNQFEVEFPRHFMLRDILPGPGYAPYQAQAPPMISETESVPDPIEKGKSRTRRFLVGVGMEIGVAAGVLGIWRLWHLIR
jgi:hypothetical protein